MHAYMLSLWSEKILATKIEIKLVIANGHCWSKDHEWSRVRILSACEKIPSSKTRIMWLQLLKKIQNTELFSEDVFMHLSGVVDSEFTLDYSLLADVLQLSG